MGYESPLVIDSQIERRIPSAVTVNSIAFPRKVENGLALDFVIFFQGKDSGTLHLKYVRTSGATYE